MVLRPEVFAGLCRARVLLCEVQEEPPTIAVVARAAGISPFHFIRQFEALFGLTPHQLRTRARLDRARQLLQAGRSVTDVCMEVGFSSLGSFSELFHRRVGSRPSAYRRRRFAGAGFAPPVPGCLGLMTGLPADAFRSFREA